MSVTVDRQLALEELYKQARGHRVEFNAIAVQEVDLELARAMLSQCRRPLRPGIGFIAAIGRRFMLQPHRLDIGKSQAEIDKCRLVLEAIAPAAPAQPMPLVPLLFRRASRRRVSWAAPTAWGSASDPGQADAASMRVTVTTSRWL